MSRLLVAKFGGAALAGRGRVRRAARRVAALGRHSRVLVVVSAAGAETDRLLARAASLAPVTAARSGHVGREVDRLLATGEDRSAALLALALHGIGVPARSLGGGEAGIVARGPFGEGAIEDIDTTSLRRLLAAGIVPVVSGFQARRPDGELVTLGRGASDVTAVALAVALGADGCHLVKDVDGIHDRDPRLHPDARPVRWMDHADLLAHTAAGTGAIHAGAAAIAARHRLPLRVYAYPSPPDEPGGTEVGTTRGTARDAGVPARCGSARTRTGDSGAPAAGPGREAVA